jgi:hypothetical protein
MPMAQAPERVDETREKEEQPKYHLNKPVAAPLALGFVQAATMGTNHP